MLETPAVIQVRLMFAELPASEQQDWLESRREGDADWEFARLKVLL